MVEPNRTYHCTLNSPIGVGQSNLVEPKLNFQLVCTLIIFLEIDVGDYFILSHSCP